MRRDEFSRRMMRESVLTSADLIYPVFVLDGNKQEQHVASMPGVSRKSIDLLMRDAERCCDLGIPAMALFPVIDAARKNGLDFLADCYPYDAWHSNIKVLMPDKQYTNPQSVEKALTDTGGPDTVTITEFKPHPEYVGRNIAELAAARKISTTDMYIQIIREGDAADTEASIIGKSMTDRDIQAFYQQPWVMVASDGGIGSQHPRGAGTFPRVLGLYVREKRWLTLPEAIHKMTGLPAQRLGWKDRGTLHEGAFADLVLFNPATVIDRATFAQPLELSTGIEKVFVNGTLVWDETKPTGAKPGRVLPR